MSKKDKQQNQPLDEETTFADMNVDGFRWYNPSKKSDDASKEPVHLTRKERRAIMKAGFVAVLPVVGIVAVAFTIVFLLAKLWLG